MFLYCTVIHYNYKQLKKLLSLLILSICFSACEKEISKLVDQDKIWTYYELFYDQNVDKTYATATFRFSSVNGTKLKLSEPSAVMVDGAQMEWQEDEGVYRNEFSGLKSSASFHWVDLNGNSFTNEITIREVSFATIVNDLHYSDSVAYLMWDGAALDSSETMSLTIDGPGNTDARVFYVDSVNATTITIDSVRLSYVDSGLVGLVLNRRYSPALTEQTSRGGQLTGRYLTDTVRVMLSH